MSETIRLHLAPVALVSSKETTKATGRYQTEHIMKNELAQAFSNFHNDESGATATEYIILLILIACFVIAVVKLFGSTVSEKFNNANTAVATDLVF